MTSARGWRRWPFSWRYCIRRTEFRRKNCTANWGSCRSRWKLLSEDLRRTARNLHPFTLTHLGLGDQPCDPTAQEFSNLRQFKVRFTARALPGTIPPGVALCVYRVVQEALGNVSQALRGCASRGIDLRQQQCPACRHPRRRPWIRPGRCQRKRARIDQHGGTRAAPGWDLFDIANTR